MFIAADGHLLLLRAEPEAAARILEVHADEKIAPDFSRITVPTLVVHGESDAIIPVEVAEMVAGAMPNCRLVRIPDAGHVPTMTRPGEVVAAIDEWWATTQPDS